MDIDGWLALTNNQPCNNKGDGWLNISGTCSVINASIIYGGSGEGTFNMNGGTVNTGNFDDMNLGCGASNHLFFNGTTIKPTANHADFITNFDTMDIKSGHAIFDTNSFDITINDQFTENAGDPGGGLIKRGTGTLTLANATESTWTGATRIEGGTLALGSCTSALFQTTGRSFTQTAATAATAFWSPSGSSAAPFFSARSSPHRLITGRRRWSTRHPIVPPVIGTGSIAPLRTAASSGACGQGAIDAAVPVHLPDVVS